MLCDKCGKNNAAVHYEQNINGKKMSMNLCSECAKQENIGYNDDFGFSFDDMFKGFFGGFGNIAPQIQTKRCPSCSTSFNDILSGGRMGCSQCYDTFRDEIDSVVRKFQPSTKHKGKLPSSMPNEVKKENKLEKLSEQLKKAVSKEDFEQAAKIRDEIKKIKGEM